MTNDFARPDLKKFLPGPVAGAAALMTQPMRDAAMLSVLSVDLAGQVFGFWMRSMINAAETSQRMLAGAVTAPLSAKAVAPVQAAETVVPRPALRLVETAAKVEVRAKPAVTAVTKAKPAVAKRVAEAAVAQPKAQAKAVQPKAPARVAKPEAVATITTATVARPAKADDLKAIEGIGPKLEQVLNGHGISTYAQIAKLDAGKIAEIERSIGVRGRIERDDWRGRAAELSVKAKRR